MNRKIFIWGTGDIARKVFEEHILTCTYDILGCIDNNKDKVGKYFYGIRIYAPDVLQTTNTDIVVILTDYFDEIKEQIKNDFPNINVIVENKYFFYKERVLRRYRNAIDPEIIEVTNYIKNNELNVFNYPFTQKYRGIKNNVEMDKDSGMYYVYYKGKRMYFPSYFSSKEAVNRYFNSIILEQDDSSPHRYMTDTFFINEGDVVVDVGVAEGNFALEVVDRVSKLYLFEADEQWIRALEYTFRDYSDKVKIIKGYVTSYMDGEYITLDESIKEPVNFIKMDIEGNEWDALNGAKELIKKSNDLKMAICCYHSDFDQELIESFMCKNNVKFTASKGFMWFPYKVRQTYTSTKLNKGIIFGTKYEE